MTTTTVANQTFETSEDAEVVAQITRNPWIVFAIFPGSYGPLKYSHGEICEPCWLTLGWVVGVGKQGCDHK